MSKEEYFLKLDENAISKLPYFGPLTRRIYIVFQRRNKEKIDEIFVQRKDAFTTNLIYVMNRLRNNEITEIRYLCGIDGFIRIFLDEKGKLVGEYFCKSRSSLDNFQEKLGLST